jgi:hypothetical protein
VPPWLAALMLHRSDCAGRFGQGRRRTNPRSGAAGN